MLRNLFLKLKKKKEGNDNMEELPIKTFSLEMTSIPRKFTLKPNVYMCRIVSITDGDTVRVAFAPFENSECFIFNVRLLDIDTPETRTMNLIEKERGFACKSHLSKLLLNNQICYLLCDDFDNFGRILGHLYIDEKRVISVNKFMIDFLNEKKWVKSNNIEVL
jgi:endonuclease YncB( thermonuclease family)